MSAIDACLDRNERYAGAFAGADRPAAPALRLAVVACMDARLDPGALLGLAEGDAHVIRNAGGLVTDDVVRSLALSQRLLGAREVMLILHTDCGVHGLADDAFARSIEQETGVRPPFAPGGFDDLEDQVRRSLDRIRSSPFLPHRDAVRGFVFEVETGRLREVV